MAERGPRADLEEAVRRRSAGGVEADTQLPRRAPEQRRVAAGLCRRHEQQALCVVRQRLDPPPKDLFETSADGQRIYKPEAAGELIRRQPARKLQRGERVPARLRDDGLADRRIEWGAEGLAEERTCIRIAQTLDPQLRQPAKVVVR